MSALATGQTLEGRKVSHRLLPDGAWLIEDYDAGPPFSSFLPGIAGKSGVPLWAMYVNRGQGMISFGPGGKDSAILEFLPATWAYQLVGVQGFRTLCRVDGEHFEPFQCNEASLKQQFKRAMRIELDRFSVEERNETWNLNFVAEYFAVVERPLPALVRRMTITNTSADVRQVQVLDGLPLMQPAAFTDEQMKRVRRLSEAYACARDLGDGLIFHSPRVKAHDEAEVIEVTEGNFFVSWLLDSDGMTSLDPLVDPGVIFGEGQDLITPRCFIAGEINREDQVWENRLGCAMAPADLLLKPGQSVTICSLIGAAPNEDRAREFVENFSLPGAIQCASEESRELISSLSNHALMVSSRPSLDAYARQNWIDNVLRGGVPHMVPAKGGEVPIHLYGRKHGDLERDYNDFHLAPNPLSDGQGNYRDICQNRRNDVWFFPEVGDAEIRMFANLLQADGYNPLVVRGYLHNAPDSLAAESVCPRVDDPKALVSLGRILSRPFSAGELLAWLNEHRIEVTSPMKWLEGVLSQCEAKLVDYGNEGGHWTDHWTYIVDMLEAYQGLWPDRVDSMLTERADIEWRQPAVRVVPRMEKHQRRSQGPLQIDAVVQRTARGADLPPVTLLGKLAALVAIKSLTFDFDGKGLEMEAGRPGWNDAMNGLPGMFGSSVCETVGLARLAKWLLGSVETLPATDFPEEIADLIEQAVDDLKCKEHDWDRAATIREQFRARLESVSGNSREIRGETLSELLRLAAQKATDGVEASTDPETGLMHTYHWAEPIGSEVIEDTDGTAIPHLRVTEMKQSPLPLFLEGQVNLLRMSDPEKAHSIWKAVRQSPLFDDNLEMYRLNESLAECPATIGRARTFSRGWFENESIWLHMSHKYLLELLRLGLAEEFHEDAQTMLVPFMDPQIYGRSILENSSFIASSVNPDPKTHGRGFVARLSGTTAEFIHMHLLLTVGDRPFRFENGELRLHLNPMIPGDWFTKEKSVLEWNGEQHSIPENAFATAFLGKALLVYHNPLRRDTYGPGAVRPGQMLFDGTRVETLDALSGKDVERIREREVNRLDIWLTE